MRASAIISLLLAISVFAACRNATPRGGVKETEAECESIEDVVSVSPGDTLTQVFVDKVGLDSLFRSGPIPDEIFKLMQGKTYKENCTVPREALRYILCLHKDISGNILVGEMVAAESIADDLLEIFRELYLNSYPIEKMRLPDWFDADDETMMEANCTSCFNFRSIGNSKKLSRHALGTAVDINPLYNPFVHTVNGTVAVEPAAGGVYADRTADFPYKIEPDDLCVRLFKAHGFTWGGNWNHSKDWQHFQH